MDALVGTPKHENVHTERRRTKADWKKVREEANAAKVAAHQERLDRAISAQSRRLQQHLADLKSSRGSIEDMLQVARACSEAEAAGAGGASISNPAPWLHNAAYVTHTHCHSPHTRSYPLNLDMMLATATLGLHRLAQGSAQVAWACVPRRSSCGSSRERQSANRAWCGSVC